MKKKLILNIDQIREMISSTLLGEMDFGKRLNNMYGESLTNDFILSESDLPGKNDILARIALQFGLDSAEELKGHSPDRMAEHIFSRTSGRPETLTFFTSGSTGIPVPNASCFSLLEQEIRALAQLFTDRKKIISLVPRQHIYGFLFSILLPEALGIPVTFKTPLLTADLIEGLDSGDLIIAFPFFWSGLTKMSCSIPANIHGVTSTGPCPAEVIRKLETQGLQRMTEVYGSSETGGVGYRHDPEDFYTLLPHWRKAGNDSLERENPDQAGFIPFIVQDSLEWKSNFVFRPLRRMDNAVQVAGTNVYPSRVEKFFNDLDAVRECSVRPMRPEEGQRLKIFIVPNSGTENTSGLETQLRTAAAALSPAERPGSYSFGKSLPRTVIGKLSDW